MKRRNYYQKISDNFLSLFFIFLNYISFSQCYTLDYNERCISFKHILSEDVDVFEAEHSKHFIYIKDSKFLEIIYVNHNRPIIAFGQINTNGILAYDFDLTGYECFFKFLSNKEFDYRFLYYENSHSNKIIIDSASYQFQFDCNLKNTIPKEVFSSHYKDFILGYEEGVIEVGFSEDRKADEFSFISGGIINSVVLERGKAVISVFSGFSEIIYTFSNNEINWPSVGSFVKRGDIIRGLSNENLEIRIVLSCNIM